MIFSTDSLKEHITLESYKEFDNEINKIDNTIELLKNIIQNTIKIKKINKNQKLIDILVERRINLFVELLLK